MHHKFNQDMGEDLRDQIASLSHEVASLRKQMTRRGKGAYRETRHMGEEAAEWMREYAHSALPEIRRNAHHLQRSARENPAATASIAAASIVVLGLLAALMARR